MRNTTLRLLSLICALTIGIFASSGWTGQFMFQDDMAFMVTSENKATAKLVKYYGREGNIVIPDRISYDGKEYWIKSIGEDAFAEDDDNHNITSIYIPSSITRIEWNAFNNLQKLQSIILPDNIENVDCLATLTKLNDLVIGKNVKKCHYYLVFSKNLYVFPTTPPDIHSSMGFGTDNLFLPQNGYKDYYLDTDPIDNHHGEDWAEYWERIVEFSDNVQNFIPSRILIPACENLSFHAGTECPFWYYFWDEDGNDVVPAEATLTTDNPEITFIDGRITCNNPCKANAILKVTDVDGQVYTRDMEVTVTSPHITIDEITYEITNKDMCEAGVYSYSGNIANVEVPSTILYNEKEYTVTSIMDYAFRENMGKYKVSQYGESKDIPYPHPLKGIRIPETVKSIGKYAFQDCKNLETIYLPAGVNSIREGAFQGTYPKMVVLGKDVNYLGTMLFDANITDFYCFAAMPPATSCDTFRGTTVKYFYLNSQSEALYRLMWPMDDKGYPITNQEGRWNYIMGNVQPLPDKVLIPSNAELILEPGQSIPLWFEFIDKEGNRVEAESYEWSLLNGGGYVKDDILTYEGGTDVLKLCVTDMGGETYKCMIPLGLDMSGIKEIYNSEYISDYGMKEEDCIYNLQGQKLSIGRENLMPGIYIINGKKIFVK